MKKDPVSVIQKVSCYTKPKKSSRNLAIRLFCRDVDGFDYSKNYFYDGVHWTYDCSIASIMYRGMAGIQGLLRYNHPLTNNLVIKFEICRNFTLKQGWPVSCVHLFCYLGIFSESIYPAECSPIDHLRFINDLSQIRTPNNRGEF